jgi:hypothetical protein
MLSRFFCDLNGVGKLVCVYTFKITIDFLSFIKGFNLLYLQKNIKLPQLKHVLIQQTNLSTYYRFLDCKKVKLIKITQFLI